MLAERSSQMTVNMHDIENKRASITKLESDLRTEKVSLMINLDVRGARMYVRGSIWMLGVQGCMLGDQSGC